MVLSGEVWAAVITVGGAVLMALIGKLWNRRADRAHRMREEATAQSDEMQTILDRMTSELDREAAAAERADRVARRLRQERDDAQARHDEIARQHRACEIERERLQHRIDVLTERLREAGGDTSW